MAVLPPFQETAGQVAGGVVIVEDDSSIGVGLPRHAAVAGVSKTHHAAGGVLDQNDAAIGVGGETDRLAAVVGGAEVSGGIVVERHPHGGAILDGKQFSRRC